MLIVDVLAHCMFHCIGLEVYMTGVTHAACECFEQLGWSGHRCSKEGG